MLIRPYLAGEEEQLRQIFVSSVHQLACQYYSVDQLNAWAPEVYDRDVWRNRIFMLKPFVAVIDGQMVAYADLQETGYIDHFYVAGHYSRAGVGTGLMRHIHQVAALQNSLMLSADVSLAAEVFFLANGFTVEKRKSVNISGVELQNVFMSKILIKT